MKTRIDTSGKQTALQSPFAALQLDGLPEGPVAPIEEKPEPPRKNGRVVLHDALHVETDLRRGRAALGMAELIDPREGKVRRIGRQRLLRGTRLERFFQMQASGPAKHNKVNQRV